MLEQPREPSYSPKTMEQLLEEARKKHVEASGERDVVSGVVASADVMPEVAMVEPVVDTVRINTKPKEQESDTNLQPPSSTRHTFTDEDFSKAAKTRKIGGPSDVMKGGKAYEAPVVVDGQGTVSLKNLGSTRAPYVHSILESDGENQETKTGTG
ncbi:MAG: hypothetical protein V1745_04245 [Patescibacteria group bacterium]